MTAKQHQYKQICDLYAQTFAKKHGYQFDGWVADEPGTIASMGDYFINFNEIKHDIDNNVPKDKYIEFYDESLEHAMLENTRKDLIRELKDAKLLPFPNYDNWLRGCPKPTAEEINKLRKTVEKARRLLEEEIDNYKNRHGTH